MALLVPDGNRMGKGFRWRTTEAIVTEKKEEEKTPPMPPGGGMDMY